MTILTKGENQSHELDCLTDGEKTAKHDKMVVSQSVTIISARGASTFESLRKEF